MYCNHKHFESSLVIFSLRYTIFTALQKDLDAMCSSLHHVQTVKEWPSVVSLSSEVKRLSASPHLFCSRLALKGTEDRWCAGYRIDPSSKLELEQHCGTHSLVREYCHVSEKTNLPIWQLPTKPATASNKTVDGKRTVMALLNTQQAPCCSGLI